MTTGPKPGTLKAGTFDAYRLAREHDSLPGASMLRPRSD